MAIETNNYIIFSSDELQVKYYDYYDWPTTYALNSEGVRNLNETGHESTHTRERREVVKYVDYNYNVVRERIDWVPERKILYRNQRFGDNDTYELKATLKQKVANIIGDNDFNGIISFSRGTFQENIHRKRNFYLIISKEYLRNVSDFSYTLTSLSTFNDGKEVIFTKNSLAEARNIAREKERNTPNNSQNPPPVNNPTIQTPPAPNVTQQTNTVNSENDYNREVADYNNNMRDLIIKITEENDKIILQGEEKHGILMSLGKDTETEVRDNLTIINGPWWFTFGLKREGRANINHNQEVETRNRIRIDDCNKCLTLKKKAVKKLEGIIIQVTTPPQINQPQGNNGQIPKPTSGNSTPTPETPNNPHTHTQKENPVKEKKDSLPVNPVLENNRNSKENIQAISTSPLVEAKSIAKKEIEDLLGRYGVNSQEINAELNEDWENYLEKLTSNEETEKIVKKIKSIIIQKNSKNNQEAVNLSLDEVKQKCKNQIKTLLQKYSGVKIEELKILNNGENWEVYLEKLTSQQAILDFARQLQEGIIHQKNNLAKNQDGQQKNLDSSPKTFLPILIPIFFLGLLVGGLVIIRQRRLEIKALKKKKKHIK